MKGRKQEEGMEDSKKKKEKNGIAQKGEGRGKERVGGKERSKVKENTTDITAAITALYTASGVLLQSRP